MITEVYGIFTQSGHASQLFTYLEVYIDDYHLTMLCLHQQLGRFWLMTCSALWLSSGTVPLTGLVFLFVHSVATLVAFFLLYVLTSISQVIRTTMFPSSSTAIATGGTSMHRHICMLYYVTTPLSGLWLPTSSCRFIHSCPYQGLIEPPKATRGHATSLVHT